MPDAMPTYQHDCSACIFIQQLNHKGVVYDVYRCPEELPVASTWVARYGDKPNMYWSRTTSILLLPFDGETTSLFREMKRIAEAYEGGNNA